MPNAGASLPPDGPTMRRAFEALVATLEERGIRYAIIGGLATIQHTRVRTTDDIDALVKVPQVQIYGLLEALKARGFDADLQRDLGELARGFSSIRFADVGVDLLQPLTPSHAHVLDRAIQANIMGREVRISSAEGLVVMKLMAMRPQDEADIRDILTAYGAKLDLEFIRAELATFSAPDDPRWVKLDAWLRQAANVETDDC